jgi:aspartate/methionine/tyrosine aminotransferase
VFSTRLPWDRAENALARQERARRDAGQPIVDLTASNPTRVGLAYPEQALRAALGGVAARGYEPAPLGLRPAREAVARDYASAGQVVDADQIVLTASSSESYALLFKLLCDPGDLILVPEPSYPLFDYLARLEGVGTVGYRLAYDGEWHVDFDSVAAAQARARAEGQTVRALVVVNPNNPTGSFVSASDLDRLGELCAGAELALISDEVFAHYRFTARAATTRTTTVTSWPTPSCLAVAPAMAERALTFSLGGLSKACGLPQLKLGWIVVGGPAAATRAALARLELITDTYLSVGGPVQRALPDLLDLGAGIRSAIQQRVNGNRARLLGAVRPGSPCSCLNADGGWTAILRVPALTTTDGASDEAWALRLLAEDGVLVHPGYLFDMPAGAYLVVSLLPEPETFTRGTAAIFTRCCDSVP